MRNKILDWRIHGLKSYLNFGIHRRKWLIKVANFVEPYQNGCCVWFFQKTNDYFTNNYLNLYYRNYLTFSVSNLPAYAILSQSQKCHNGWPGFRIGFWISHHSITLFKTWTMVIGSMVNWNYCGFGHFCHFDSCSVFSLLSLL